MSPCILFERKASEYLTVRVRPESIREYITDAKAFNRLLQKLSDRVYHDVVNGGHKALPLGDELKGKWLCASPVGAEYSTPPAQWCFSERLAMAMSKETHPLMVIPAIGLTENDIKEAIRYVLGDSALEGKIEIHVERTALDESLDNLFSGCGGTC